MKLQPTFGTKRDQIWKQFADKVSGIFEKQQLSEDIKITANVDEWIVILDNIKLKTQHGETTFTRIRAPFINNDDFKFVIYKETMIDEIKKMLGMQDIKTGVSEFDKNYVIQSSNEEKAKILFSNPRIRDLLTSQPHIYMEIKEDDGVFNEPFPDGVDELYCLIQEELQDVNHLEALFNLYAEVLHTLTHLGSAYENDASLNL